MTECLENQDSPLPSQLTASGPTRPIPLARLDGILASLLAGSAAGAIWIASGLLDPVLYDIDGWDVWFQSDIPRVVESITERSTTGARTHVHPIFPITGYAGVTLLRKLLGLDMLAAVRLLFALTGGLWLGLFYGLLRLICPGRIDALLFALIAGTSASALFGFVIPDTFSLGSLTIVFALGLSALAESRPVSLGWYIMASAATLGITVTNWMAGLAATFGHLRWKQALSVTLAAFGLVIGVWAVQKGLFPATEFFIGTSHESRFVLAPETGGIWPVLRAFFLHVAVMPAIQPVTLFVWRLNAQWPQMSVQAAEAGSGSPWGGLTLVCWLAVLGLGVATLIRHGPWRGFRFVLAGTLAGQVALHLLFGEETFLYSLHFLPPLVMTAALATTTPYRLPVLVLAALLLVGMASNNVVQFQVARDFFPKYSPPRHQVTTQMRLRKEDPWPRSQGHVVLGYPGSTESEKAYLEPGGGFSPAVGSMGLSIWVLDGTGAIKATSDGIPISDVRQSFRFGATMPPAVVTDTPFYRADWSSPSVGRWVLTLQPRRQDVILTVAIRGVGPAAGPITDLEWAKDRLLVNGRWSVTLSPSNASLFIGEEGQVDWISQRTTARSWHSATGWGFARLEFGKVREARLTIEDTQSAGTVPQHGSTEGTRLKLNLPDQRFVESVLGQVAHLKMGLVGQETRPGDPLYYPVPGVREATKIVTALARAGELETAATLSERLAEEDFFGATGSEADGPGATIWALEEVASRWHRPEFDRAIWPHVKRKADFIVRMRSTLKPLFHEPAGLIATRALSQPRLKHICGPSREGLIMGRVEHREAVLYVNAVSYRGLRDAAALAGRLGYQQEAAGWSNEADQLLQRWEEVARASQFGTDWLSYGATLWPTWAGARSTDVFLPQLQGRWEEMQREKAQTPSNWTQIELAIVHQWLLLGKPAPVWESVEWFWNHQDSPGLYTWGSGKLQSGTLENWERFRGWVSSANATPSYWSSAEMLLLQLDMLAYVDRTGPQSTLVLGAGVPSSWLHRPFVVEGMPTSEGIVDWSWDGQALHVRQHGKSMPIRLGSAFPQGTTISSTDR